MSYLKSISIIALVAAFTVAPVSAQDSLTPKEHFKIERPVKLSPDEANKVYDDLIEKMAAGYAQSHIVLAKDYRNWQRENSSPYLSAGHGNRFLNNYSNPKGEGYLKLRRGEKMPVGAILAKDSFTVTEDKEIFPGALFIMEKTAPGINPKTDDWRYVMIMPDGSLLGDSNVADDESMKFCHDCHQRAKSRDFLFLIPQAFRSN